jgi:hypothetical protein
MIRERGIRAFTLAEVMIAMVGSMIILGGLLLGSTQLQRALYASERYATKQTDQRRLMDYLGRDLRRAVGLAVATTVNGTGGTRLSGAAVAVEKDTSLVITLPGYYQSDSPDQLTYDEALPVVVANNYVDYGTTDGPAPGVVVMYRKVYVDSERCECFVRIEDDTQNVIVREAQGLQLQVASPSDGRSVAVDVIFNPSRNGMTARVRTHDQILMRNIRND